MDSRLWTHRRIRALTAAFAAAVLAALGSLLAVVNAPSAHAASLVQVTNFGSNPTNLLMYEYVPTTVQQHPPILLALHQCTGSGPGFYSGTEFASLADRYGFIVIYPSVTRSYDCWDVSSPSSLTHSGNNDPAGLISMIHYVEQHDNGDAGRVYVTGASSGGMMTNVMLGDYPDVFQAGAAYMGVPFGCFATTDGSQWNSACAQGQITKTPQQWGDLVRGAYPGYSGPRPRMQLWHGTADTTLYYQNFGEEIKQWTNVLGVPQTPSVTDNSPAWTRTVYTYADGRGEVEAYSVTNVGHSLPQSGMAVRTIGFFGLDGSTQSGSPTSTTTPSIPSTTPSTPDSSASGGATCKVSDMVSGWNNGLTEAITIANTGTAAVSGWRLAFTLPSGQTVTNAWNATITPAGGAVTAANVSYNAAIPAGGSTSFGFQATHTGNAAAPTGFTLNGSACSIG